MSGRNEISKDVSNFVYGIAPSTNPNLVPQGAALKLVNAELIKRGIVAKAKGYVPIATWLNNRVYELLHFIRSGVDVVMCFGINSAGTTGGVGYISGTWSSGLAVTSTLTGTAASELISLVQGDDCAYFFDGTNDKYFNGTSWLQIGLDQPDAAPTCASTCNGSLTENGQYLFEIRRYNENTGARSKPSSVSLAMTAGTAGANTDGLVINFSAASATLDTHTEIYRTVASGTAMFLEDRVAASVTAFSSTIADSTLTRNAYAETGDDNPPKMKIVRVGENEMLGVEVANPNRVRWCKYSDQYGTMWQSWPQTNFADCDPQDNDVIKAVHYVNETWFVFKQRSMGRLVDMGSYRLYRKLADIGITGIRAACSFNNFVAWMSKHGVHCSDGTSVKDIAGGPEGVWLQQEIQELNHNVGYRFSACDVPKRKQIRFSVVTSGNAYPNKIYVGHYHNFESQGFIAWTTREPGPSSSYPGIKTGSQEVITDSSGIDQWIFGTSDGTGLICKGDYGDSDNGSAIYADWHFHRESFGRPKLQKTATDFDVEVQSTANSTTIQVGLRRNGSQTVDMLKTQVFDAQGFLLDIDSLDAGVTLGEPYSQPITVPCNRDCRDAAVVIRNTESKYIEVSRFSQNAIMGSNR